MFKKLFMFLMVAVSLFSFNNNVEAKVLGSYDLYRNSITSQIPEPTSIFTFAVVSPRTVTVHRGDLRRYIEADCLARDEFIVVSQSDLIYIRKDLNKFYNIKSHGFYNFRYDRRVQNFVAHHGLKNTLKVSFHDKY